MPRQIEQRIDLEDTHAFRARADLEDLIPGFHLAFLKNAEIETGPAVRDQQRGHLRFVHADTDAVTSDARLCHFKQRAADPVAVANADLPVRKAVDREVLPELSVGEIIAAKLALPIAIGVDLIDENGAVLAAVPNQVSLPIAIDIETADRARRLERGLSKWRCGRSSLARRYPAGGPRLEKAGAPSLSSPSPVAVGDRLVSLYERQEFHGRVSSRNDIDVHIHG